MPNLFYPPHAYIPSAAGLPQAGAKAYFYVTATSTLKNTYSDFALTTPNANPVVADANGVWGPIYMSTDVNYRVTVKTSADVLIYTQDDVPGPLMSQADLGAILYPRTAAEISASVTPTNYSYPPYDLRRYNVKGDGTTDDTAALNAVGSTATWAQNVSFTCPPGFNMKTTDTVTFKSPYCALMMDPSARITYSGTLDRACLVLGTDAGSFVDRDFNVSVSTSGNTWVTESCIGVQIRGSWSANRVRLNYASGFTVNWQLWGTSTSGIAYNTFDLGSSWDSRFFLDLHSAVANGFINENLFINGQIQVSSGGGLTTGTTCFGITFRAEVGAYTGQNKNYFIKPCIQITQAGITVDRIPVVFTNAGANNQIVGMRCEGLNGEAVRVSADTTTVNTNTIDIAYCSTANGTVTAFMTETDGGFSYGNRITLMGLANSQYYHSGDIVKKCWSPSAGNVAVMDMFAHVSGSATEQTSMAARIGKDYLIMPITSRYGVYVDTSYFKNFEVFMDSISGFCGRINITAWDVNDAQISSTRAVYFGGAGQAATYGTASYSQQSDARGIINFRVDSTVKKIKLMFGSGTNQAYLRAFSIIAHGAQLRDINTVSGSISAGLNVWGGPFAPTQLLSTNIPTGATIGNGYTQRGLIVGNTAAAVAAPQGWICTLGGWNARLWVLSTAYLVNDIVLNGANTYVCTVSGTSAGAGGPAGTGSAIVDNTVTWNYIGNYVGIPVVTAATWSAMPNL